jgi:hypothetical protein
VFRNMAASLLKQEMIRTTLPEVKELRRVVASLIRWLAPGSICAPAPSSPNFGVALIQRRLDVR